MALTSPLDSSTFLFPPPHFVAFSSYIPPRDLDFTLFAEESMITECQGDVGKMCDQLYAQAVAHCKDEQRLIDFGVVLNNICMRVMRLLQPRMLRDDVHQVWNWAKRTFDIALARFFGLNPTGVFLWRPGTSSGKCPGALSRDAKISDTKYPRITYYWTVHLILDHSHLVGRLKSFKIVDTEVSGL